MANINIINKNSIMKKLGRCLTIGLVGLIAYSGVGITRNVSDYLKYSSRRENVSGLIVEGDLDAAESLLNSLRESCGLEKPDIDVLTTRLVAERTKKDIKKLDELIQEGSHDKAQEIYSKLISEGAITPDNSYLTKINKISLEGILKTIKQSSGEEKISLIDRMLLQYPNYQSAQELRKEQAEAYLSVASSYFVAGSAESKVSDFLGQFNRWIEEQNNEAISHIDFSDFLKNSEDYVSYRKLIKSQSENIPIEIGDKVRIVRSLGHLSVKRDGYNYLGWNMENFPIGKIAVVVGEEYSGRRLKVSYDDNNSYMWFISRELERINENDLSQVLIQIGQIKKHIAGDEK